MVEDGGGPVVPVVFYDGEREMNIGDVKINPTLEYKPFQLMLSQKIGISPNQISIYLVDRRKDAVEERRRIPITGKVNFALICRQKDCYFLVVLKRSRKSRNRRERMIEFGGFLPENEFSAPQMQLMPDNMVLLRRNQELPFYDQITQAGLADLNDRLQSMRVQREHYHASIGKGKFNSPNLNPDTNPVPSKTMTMTKNEPSKIFCQDCANEIKYLDTTAFHHCINDAVITRFTTRFGPINRPKKSLQ